MRRYSIELVIFFTALLLFCPWWGHANFVGFETRFVLFAKNMVWHGFSFFPQTYGHYYPDYLSTSTALIVFFSLILGGVNAFSAILPTAIASSLGLVVTYRIASLVSRRWGLFAVLMSLLTFEFVSQSRTISQDQWVMLATCLGFYALMKAEFSGLQQKSTPYFYLFACLLMGFLFRENIGVLIPTGVFCGVLLIQGRLKPMFLCGGMGLVVAVVGLLLMLGAAFYLGGDALMQQVWWMQVGSRLQHNAAAPPWHYYLIGGLGSLSLSYPLALLVLWCRRRILLAGALTKDARLLKGLFVYAGIILIGMSIPGDKKMRYITAVIPALALLASYPFASISEEWQRFRRCFQYAMFGFPVIVLIGLSFLMRYPIHEVSVFATKNHLLYFLLLSLFIGIISWYFKKNRELLACLTGVMCLFFIVIVVVEPAMQAHDSVAALINTIEKRCPGRRLGIYRLNKDGAIIKYLANVPYPVKIISVPSTVNFPKKLCVLMPRKMKNGGGREIGSGRLGHKKISILKK